LYIPQSNRETQPFYCARSLKNCRVLKILYELDELPDCWFLVAGMLARSQYPEDPATGHLRKGFSWFRCVYKRELRWFPRLQVVIASFSCSPPDLIS